MSPIDLPPPFQARFFATIGSTSDAARDLSRDGAPHGTVVWAGAQTGGRGRHGRQWSSPPGNLYATILLRPPPGARLTDLGFLAAVAVAEAVDTWLGAAGPAVLKWPNDVLANGRKLAGILVEAEDAAALLGIGVNLRAAPAQAASVQALCGIPPAPAAALAELLARLGIWLGRWHAGGFGPVREAWLARGPAPGVTVRAHTPAGAREGAFAGLDADGALLLEDAEGTHRITAGEAWLGTGSARQAMP